MKKVFITILCLSASVAAVKAQNQAVNTPPPPPQPVQAAPAPPVPPPPPPAKVISPTAGEFKFKEETHDYGEVMEGPTAETDFEFKNVGKEPIIISEAHGSCGCTVPKWPQEPILPGKKGVIHVTYNTQGRQGPIMKDVTINSNAKQQPMVLHIRGTVKPKPVEATPAQAPAQGH
jgi:hypothetical protein